MSYFFALRLRRIHNMLCAVAVAACALASYFELRKWQVVSKGLIKKGEEELRIPFAFSLVTAFFQLLPGTASLFLPVLSTMITTESNRFHLANIPRFSCQGMENRLVVKTSHTSLINQPNLEYVN